ncbi:MAG: hypothetical protein EBY17_30655, partial [Acidobacteriia bacterium]|nr:hypothetical protein [Terriglobia bacterium]
QRWLLVNIQSPTEFASQQLNADTWHDETLQAWSGGQSGELRFSTLAAGKEDGAFSGGVHDGMAAAL